ncbi:MAG TPA: LysE family translocator, partial [Arenicellales bacterium]|nr:LysE family translocator [Arenicellales bacterium]
HRAAARLSLMLDGQVTAVFFAASLMLGLAPGPDNLFVLTQSALQGRAAGLFVTAGLCTGLLVHTTAVAVGVAALIQSSMFAFTVLKFIGAGYLLYLAWQAFRASTEPMETGQGKVLQPKRLYLRGIIMNVTNPKVSIFFLAFLPQFVDPARGPVIPQIIQLGLLFIVATVLVFGSVSILAGTFGQWLNRSEAARRFLNWAAGFIFLGLAVRLAVAER